MTSGRLRQIASPIPPGTNALITRVEAAREAAVGDELMELRHTQADHLVENIRYLSDLSSGFFRRPDTREY